MTTEYLAHQNFSIINNPNETVQYFNNIISYIINNDNIRNKGKNFHIKINMENVKEITIDALMYLLGLIKNIKVRFCNIYWSGNLPKEEHVADIVKRSGFLKFVNNNIKMVNYDKSNIKITSGQLCDPELSGNICDFVKNRVDNFSTKVLQKILIELMLNVKNHAYTRIENMKLQWYIFVEEKEKTIQFTFIDTGLGIPRTVSKKITEKLNMKDSDYIYSTFKIDSGRTRTKKEYRGSGLPFVKDCEKINYITNLTLISNKGYYNQIKKYDLSQSVQGTVFYWEINKIGEKYDNNKYSK